MILRNTSPEPTFRCIRYIEWGWKCGVMCYRNPFHSMILVMIPVPTEVVVSLQPVKA